MAGTFADTLEKLVATVEIASDIQSNDLKLVNSNLSNIADLIMEYAVYRMDVDKAGSGGGGPTPPSGKLDMNLNLGVGSALFALPMLKVLKSLKDTAKDAAEALEAIGTDKSLKGAEVLVKLNQVAFKPSAIIGAKLYGLSMEIFGKHIPSVAANLSTLGTKRISTGADTLVKLNEAVFKPTKIVTAKLYGLALEIFTKSLPKVADNISGMGKKSVVEGVKAMDMLSKIQGAKLIVTGPLIGKGLQLMSKQFPEIAKNLALMGKSDVKKGAEAFNKFASTKIPMSMIFAIPGLVILAKSLPIVAAGLKAFADSDIAKGAKNLGELGDGLSSLGTGIALFLGKVGLGMVLIGAGIYLAVKGVQGLGDAMIGLSEAGDKISLKSIGKISLALMSLAPGLTLFAIGGALANLVDTDKLKELGSTIQQFATTDVSGMPAVSENMLALDKALYELGKTGFLMSFVEFGAFSKLANDISTFADIDSIALINVADAIMVLNEALSKWGGDGFLEKVGNSIMSFFTGGPFDEVLKIAKKGPELQMAGDGVKNVVSSIQTLQTLENVEEQGKKLDKFISTVQPAFSRLSKSMAELQQAGGDKILPAIAEILKPMRQGPDVMGSSMENNNLRLAGAGGGTTVVNAPTTNTNSSSGTTMVATKGRATNDEKSVNRMMQ